MGCAGITPHVVLIVENPIEHVLAVVRLFQERNVICSMLVNTMTGPAWAEHLEKKAKAEAERAYSYAADRSIQFHGAFGFTYDCDAQLHRRRAVWCASQFGDAAYHRRTLAALIF